MLFNNASQRQIDTGLAILRTVIGIIFIAHGGQKLFVYGLEGVTGAFGQMGVPFPAIMGPFVALVELLGGGALVVGLLTRLAALGLGITMLVAIVLVHWKAGFFLPNGYEFALSLLGASTLLTLTGAGNLSLDALISRLGEARRETAAPVPVPTRRAA